jgi:hypothetical protein
LYFNEFFLFREERAGLALAYGRPDLIDTEVEVKKYIQQQQQLQSRIHHGQEDIKKYQQSPKSHEYGEAEFKKYTQNKTSPHPDGDKFDVKEYDHPEDPSFEDPAGCSGPLVGHPLFASHSAVPTNHSPATHGSTNPSPAIHGLINHSSDLTSSQQASVTRLESALPLGRERSITVPHLYSDGLLSHSSGHLSTGHHLSGPLDWAAYAHSDYTL